MSPTSTTADSGRGELLWRLAISGCQPVKVLDGVVEWAFVVFARGIYHVDRPAPKPASNSSDFATGSFTTVARNLGTSGTSRPPLPTGARSSLAVWTPPSTT